MVDIMESRVTDSLGAYSELSENEGQRKRRDSLLSADGVLEDLQQDLAAAVSNASDFGPRAIVAYFLFGLTREILQPLAIVSASAGIALLLNNYFGISAKISYQPFTPAQTVLGFLTGFYLNHAFDRNQRALEAVQSMSIRLRTFAHIITGFIFDNYYHDEQQHLTEKFRQDILGYTNEIIGLCKYYYISCCMDLNMASLIKEGENVITSNNPAVTRWQAVGVSQVTLTPYAGSQVRLLLKHFKSGVHFDLLAQQWIHDAVQRVAPTVDKLHPVDTEDEEDEKERVLAEMTRRWNFTRRLLRKNLNAARHHFLKAHKIANGRTSPVHFWLLGLLMYLLCVAMPWVIVSDYGYFCFVPSLLLAYIFFGARQIGADFWEPFGMDAEGLVDVDLQRACRMTCSTMDQFVPFFAAVEELRYQHDKEYKGTDLHNVLMRLRR